MASYSVPSYDSFTRSMAFDTPYKPLNISPSADVVDAYSNAITRRYEAPLDIPESRSTWGRIGDALSVGVYPLAGFMKGMLDDNQPNQITPWQGLVNGFKASNPFGEGFAKGETTWSDVLETAGWHPDSVLGKIAKGTLGFAGDVLLDPTTYLTGGVSALVKGTGRAGIAMTHALPAIKALEDTHGLDLAGKSLSDIPNAIYQGTIDKFAGQPVNPNLVERLAFKNAEDARLKVSPFENGMTPDIASEIITKQAKDRGILDTLTPESISTDSEKLSKEFNRIIGLRDESQPIKLSLSNAPFGNKLFGWTGIADKGLTLGSGDTLREIGESTIAPAYAKLRDAIYGSKLGELFSTVTPLYRISKEDPAKLYDFLKFTEYTRGLNADKIASEKAIRDKAKTMNLTPSETKQVLDMMQNPTVWGKVAETVNFLDTETAKNWREKISGRSAKAQQELSDLGDMHANVQALQYANDHNIVHAQSAVTQLRDEYRYKLLNLQHDHLLESADREKLIQHYTDEIKRLDDEEASVLHASPEQTLTPELLKKRWMEGTDAELTRKNNKTQLAEDLSNYIHGSKDYIAPSTYQEHLDTLLQKAVKGETKDKLIQHMEDNPDVFNGRSAEVNPFIAKQIGYGKGTPFKNWDEFYTKRMEQLIEQTKNGVPLEARQQRLLAQLQRADLGRKVWLSRFRKANSMDDVMKIITDHTQAELEGGYKSIEHLQNATHGFVPSEFEKGFNQFGDNYGVKLNVDSTTKLSDTQHEQIFNDLVDNIYFKSTKEKKEGEASKTIISDVNKISPAHVKWINSVMDEINPLLKDFFHKNYEDLSPKQKDFLLNLAQQNAFNRSSGKDVIQSSDKTFLDKVSMEVKKRLGEQRVDAVRQELTKGDTIAYKHEGTMWKGTVNKLIKNENGSYSMEMIRNDGLKHEVPISAFKQVTREGVKLTADDLIAHSPVTRDFVTERNNLVHKLGGEKLTQTINDNALGSNRTSLVEEYKTKLAPLEKNLEDLQSERDALRHAMDHDVPDQLEKKADEVLHFENIVNNDDAFTTYMNTHFSHVVADATKPSTDAGKRLFELDDSIPAHVKNLLKSLRGDLIQIGEKEVEMGKLKEDQFHTMMDSYLPHIATPEGASFFASKEWDATTRTWVDKEIGAHTPSLTKMYGFGTKWNPFMKERTIKGIVLDGEYIEHPTIQQINQLLSPMLNGKNAFSENIADIYLARALKHTELVYDHEYMNSMMNVFGKELPHGADVEKGYKAVVNYGQLKETLKQLTTNLVRNEIEMRKATGNFNAVSREEFQQLFEYHSKAVLDRLHLKPETLDQLKTPMVELSKEQIQAIQLVKPHLIRQVNDAIVQKANQARKLQIAKDQSRFLQMYDKFTHFMKLNQTTIMPSFHIRNKFSNMFLNWLGVGSDAVNPTFQKNAFKVVKAKGDIANIGDMRPLEIRKPDGTVDVMHWNEVYELAKVHGVVDEGFFAKDLGANAMSKGIFKKVPSKFDPTDTANFLPYKVGASVGSLIENSDRLIHFASMLKQGHSIEDSAKSVEKFLFDYSDLTSFEQSVMKRLMPYYTWLRKSGALQMDQLLSQPGKYRDTFKAENAIEHSNNSDERMNKGLVSDFAKDWLQLPSTSTPPPAKGAKLVKGAQPASASPQPIILNPNLPFQDLNRIPNPLHPLDSLKSLFTQSNPLIKVPVEQALNHNTFFDSPIVDPKSTSPLADRMSHVLGNFALFNAYDGLANKSGLDAGLQALNIFGGIKAISYNYDAFKYQKLDELKKAGNQDNPVVKLVGHVLGTISGTIVKNMGLDVSPQEQHKMVNATVMKVTDGDTISVKVGDKEEQVRFLLVNTPETVKKNTPVMPFGLESSSYTHFALPQGKEIQLTFDGNKRDPYNRLLAYVNVGERDINKELVDHGLARVGYLFNGNNYTRLNDYEKSQKDAISRKVGIWSLPGYANPDPHAFGDGYNMGVVSQDRINQDTSNYREMKKKWIEEESKK